MDDFNAKINIKLMNVRFKKDGQKPTKLKAGTYFQFIPNRQCLSEWLKQNDFFIDHRLVVVTARMLSLLFFMVPSHNGLTLLNLIHHQASNQRVLIPLGGQPVLCAHLY
jgi:hypothetical protein